MVGHLLRCGARYVRLHDAVHSGAIGEPLTLCAERLNRACAVRLVSVRARRRLAMAHGEILVRALEPEDSDAVAEISTCPSVIAGTLGLPFRSRAERRERLLQSQEGVHRLVAEVEGRVVGVLGLHVETNPRRRHCAGLGIAVHDRVQGQGVGTALLAAAIDLADNWLGLRRLELHVYPDNAAGIRLYEKFGFVVEGTARDFGFRNGEFVDALMMSRLRTSPGGDRNARPRSR